ncbi:MAG: hypothetical protein IPG44_08345 [Anaerolineales bacterium]|nr:hypothetical protein [Anaerolineales bacterium]
MRRARTLIFVLLIVIIAVVVGFVLLRQLFTPSDDGNQITYVDIYYAAQNIPQGGRVTEDALLTLSIPQEKVVSVMFTAEELPFLVDKFAKVPLEQGVVITEGMVGDASAAVSIPGPEWAALIPPGMIAMSVPIDRLGTSGYAVNNGAHVNVNVCLLFVDVDPSYQTILPNLTAILTGTGLGGVLQGADETGFSTQGLPILSLGVVSSGAAQGRLELDPSVQQPYYLIPSEAQRPRTVCQTLLPGCGHFTFGRFSPHRNHGGRRRTTASGPQCGTGCPGKTRSCNLDCDPAGFGHAFLSGLHQCQDFPCPAQSHRSIPACDRGVHSSVPFEPVQYPGSRKAALQPAPGSDGACFACFNQRYSPARAVKNLMSEGFRHGC